MNKRREKNKPQSTADRQPERPVMRPNEKNENLIQLGKFFYSLAGMTYAGIILTVLIDFSTEKVMTLYWGGVATGLLAWLAWNLVKIGNNKK